ncbi:uncharacterized protein JCM10292_004276 [Rhodotorula paludigena]|uniref:uncharacterized protein n=1 Tax=Rhodotorula paludigena TaxID=86838 RepID=UPI00317CE2CE
MRVPPALEGRASEDVGSVAGPTGGASEGRRGTATEQAGAEHLMVPAVSPYPLRRANSADLLVRMDGSGDEDDTVDGAGFSSDDESFRFRPPSIASTTTSQRSSRRGVRVEDWTERQSTGFVRDVRVPSYHAVGSEGSGFVVFDIQLETIPLGGQAQGTSIRIHKRYSAFVRLRGDLLKSDPRFHRLVPRLPPKSSFGAVLSALAPLVASDASTRSQIPPVLP